MSDPIKQLLLGESDQIPWLQDFRQRARACCETLPFPGRKTENWKYTSLRSLESGVFSNAAQRCKKLESCAELVSIPQLDSFKLVFVNGFFEPSLSGDFSSAPEGLEIALFSQASEQQQQEIADNLGDEPEQTHLFAAVNSAKLSEGLFIKACKNATLSTPVHIVFINTHAEQAYSINQRLLLLLEENAELTLIEHFVSADARQNDFTNGVTELKLAANARLNHYRLNLEQEQALHIGKLRACLQRSARLNSFFLGLGGVLKRLDVSVEYQGEGAEAQINGVYLSQNKQHIDYHTCIEHAVPHCTSNEVFRGIVADSSRAVFNGRIHIHPDAQKTLAQLSNKNLLTSNKAEVDTKPELEIYADDVQCAHGATVAQLDENAMHYLQARGVSKAEARIMLSFGFINELINGIQLEPVANYLRPQLVNMFSSDDGLKRHLL